MKEEKILQEKTVSLSETTYVKPKKPWYKRFFTMRTLFILTLVTIPLLKFLVFFVANNVRDIIMIFQRYDEKGNVYWTLENFELLFRDFARDGIGLEALKNTMGYFWMGVALLLTTTVIFSYLSYKNLWGDTFRRIASAGAGLMNGVAVSLIVMQYYNPGGIFSNILTQMKGLDKPAQIFQDDRFANGGLFFITFMNSLAMNLILRGTMMRIPEEVIEYGNLDGLKWFQELYYVILPMVWPTMVTLLTLQFTGILTASGPVIYYTQGGHGTMTFSYWLYSKKLNALPNSNSLNYASTIAMFMTVVATPIVFLVKWALDKVMSVVEY
jgi:ABC-type sugar transport system permease subunit